MQLRIGGVGRWKSGTVTSKFPLRVQEYGKPTPWMVGDHDEVQRKGMASIDKWKVVWKGGVYERNEKSISSKGVRSAPKGSIIRGCAEGNWIVLVGGIRYMMVRHGHHELLKKVGGTLRGTSDEKLRTTSMPRPEPVTTTNSANLISRYKQSLGARTAILAVQVDVLQINAKLLSPAQRARLKTIFATELARTAGVNVSAVEDLHQQAASVTLSSMATDALVVDARVNLPPSKDVHTAKLMLGGLKMKARLKQRLSEVSEPHVAIGEELRTSMIVVAVGESSKDGFSSVDTNKDGFVDRA